MRDIVSWRRLAALAGVLAAGAIGLGAAASQAAEKTGVAKQTQYTGPGVELPTVAAFPDVELVSYVEEPAANPLNTDATVKLRAVNNGSARTDPTTIKIKDANGLMRQGGAALKVDALKPGESSPVMTVHLSPILPPAAGSQPYDQPYVLWNGKYGQSCGVDLSVAMDWAGAQAQAPRTSHADVYLYQGFHNSQPWQENHPVSKVTVCDAGLCVRLIDVARNVYKQIGCKVVGYALFVGDATTRPHAVYDAFGYARTTFDPPQRLFTPATPMQIASSSKVLTAITAMKAMGQKFDEPAYQFFPSTWKVPVTSIVRNITSHQLVSQTSGIMQYYAGPNGQDYADLKTFFTQQIANPNAPFKCPGPPQPGQSRIIGNPIVATNQPCYTDTNFGIMRLVIPRAAGVTNADDNATLAQKYVDLVKAHVWAPLGVTGPDCKPPAAPGYALSYVYPGTSVYAPSGDWGDTTSTCGDWGWYVSVEEYAKLLVSLNSADHKVLSDCQLYEVEHNPRNHPIGFDVNTDGQGHRYLEKNGAEGTGNGALETTSVAIFLGHSGCAHIVTAVDQRPVPTTPAPGVAAALWINSNINGAPQGVIASNILQNAFEATVKPQ